MDKKMAAIKSEVDKVNTLCCMLHDNVKTYVEGGGIAGLTYPQNHNASKSAILNQITILRNELLVLAETIRN